MKNHEIQKRLKDKREQLRKWEREGHDIVEAVCFHYGVSVRSAKSKCRRNEIINARQISCYIMRKVFYKETKDEKGVIKVQKMSLEKIGKYFDIDHATVGYSIQTVENLLEVDKAYKKLAETLFYELIPEYNEPN